MILKPRVSWLSDPAKTLLLLDTIGDEPGRSQLVPMPVARCTCPATVYIVTVRGARHKFRSAREAAEFGGCRPATYTTCNERAYCDGRWRHRHSQGWCCTQTEPCEWQREGAFLGGSLLVEGYRPEHTLAPDPRTQSIMADLRWCVEEAAMGEGCLAATAAAWLAKPEVMGEAWKRAHSLAPGKTQSDRHDHCRALLAAHINERGSDA